MIVAWWCYCTQCGFSWVVGRQYEAETDPHDECGEHGPNFVLVVNIYGRNL